MPRRTQGVFARDPDAAQPVLDRKNGRGDRIRTCDPLLPKQMRYQAALLPAFVLRTSAGEPAKAVQAFSQTEAGLPAEAPQRSEGWWARRDSNPQPSRYERPALPLSYRPRARNGMPGRPHQPQPALSPCAAPSPPAAAAGRNRLKRAASTTSAPPTASARLRTSRSAKPRPSAGAPGQSPSGL
jgi:hypothetical protein